MSQNPVTHFELGYFECERAKKFYETAFGWKMKALGPAKGDYILAQTADVDEIGLVTTPGTVNGGFYQKTESPQSHAPSMVISVTDIRSAMRAVEAAGGKLLASKDGDLVENMQPVVIPGVGLWVAFQDTENNRVSLFESGGI